MKPTLLAFALVVALSLTAAAQKPASSHHLAGGSGPGVKYTAGTSPQVPALCRPCLFYGGDLNPDNINAAGLSDENTLLIPGGSSTYAAVNLPVAATVYGIVFNVQADAAFDPLQGTYDIRTGVSEGNGGTSVASGSGNVVVSQTGRNFLGLYEYTVALSWSTAVTLNPGEYWFNVTPQCLNTLDGSCSVFRQFASTSQGANSSHGNWQPVHELFLNSTYFGATWANWCDPQFGLDAAQCTGLSFGLRGSASE